MKAIATVRSTQFARGAPTETILCRRCRRQPVVEVCDGAHWVPLHTRGGAPLCKTCLFTSE